MKKILIFITILLFCVQFGLAKQIIINSEDWRDVYSGVQYGVLTDQPTGFLVSDKHSTIILGTIPKGTEIEAISSDDTPFIIGYDSILESRGYPSEELIYDNFNLELANRLTNITNFIIVDDSYGYNAISVAPYAAVSKSYVLFADADNIGEVTDFLAGRTVDSLIIYGITDREVRDALQPYNPEIININGDRFSNNIEITKKYQKIVASKQTILTNGEFIEKELMSGSEPVLFIGTNNVPDQVRDYIQSSDIEVGVLVGNELVGTATFVRRTVGISVFVKFAQGARQPKGAISQVEALDMFYLPVYNLNIEVESIRYNRATSQLEVNIRNTEEQAVYMKGTYALSSTSGTQQSVGDVDPVFLDGQELKTLVYDLEQMGEGNITADIFIIYGESPGSLEKVIDTNMFVEQVEVFDNCEIDLTDLVYNPRSNRFEIKIRNTGDVDCYARLEVVDLEVDGLEQTFASDGAIQIKKGATKTHKVKADLTDEDIEANKVVKVVAYYGERESSLVKVKPAEFPMKLAGIDYMSYGLILVIIILLILIIWKRRKKKKEED